MDFTREGLAAKGFAGFVTWNDLSWDEVPLRPGVYVVMKDGPNPPEILSRNPAGWFKERDPTASRTALEAAWVEGCTIVYIGKLPGCGPGCGSIATMGRESRSATGVGATSGNSAAAANYASPGKSPVSIHGSSSRRCSPPSSNATANYRSRT
jgi:hypothetical protein